MAKGQARDQKREAHWRALLAKFGRSGQSVRGFCAAEGLSEPSFYSWRRVIQERDSERGRRRPAFVPVMVSNHAVNSDAGIVIELRGGRAMRLPSALPVRQVAELVHAIEAASALASVGAEVQQ
jgi:hypothetical protein